MNAQIEWALREALRREGRLPKPKPPDETISEDPAEPRGQDLNDGE